MICQIKISGEGSRVMFYIGCHLSKEGGYLAMGQRALSIGGNTFQFFTRNPRGGSTSKSADPEDVAALCRLMEENNMHAPLAHAPYTYNPCSADESIREYTASSMHSELELLESIDGAMYNFHPGCHVGQGADAGIEFVSGMLDSIMWEGMKTIVLIETMAGKGTEIGRSFEELSRIIERVNPLVRDNVGVCLDTCHVHDGGYPIAEDPAGVLDEFDRVLGLERLRAIHLNDSKNPVGAAKDRHERLGHGNIPLSSMEKLINDPRLEGIPFYLETPCDLNGYAEEIKLLRSLKK